MAIELTSKVTESRVNGVVTLAYEENEYVKNAPVDEKTLKELEKYNHEYIKTVTEDAAERAKEIMTSDKEVNKVVLKAPFTTRTLGIDDNVKTKGAVEVGIDRSKTFKIPGKEETVTKTAITVSVTNPVNKMGKTRLKELEKDLTAAILG